MTECTERCSARPGDGRDSEGEQGVPEEALS
jgi:hypothetical protein